MGCVTSGLLVGGIPNAARPPSGWKTRNILGPMRPRPNGVLVDPHVDPFIENWTIRLVRRQSKAPSDSKAELDKIRVRLTIQPVEPIPF